jgi:hypothetical protein
MASGRGGRLEAPPCQALAKRALGLMLVTRCQLAASFAADAVL